MKEFVRRTKVAGVVVLLLLFSVCALAACSGTSVTTKATIASSNASDNKQAESSESAESVDATQVARETLQQAASPSVSSGAAEASNAASETSLAEFIGSNNRVCYLVPSTPSDSSLFEVLYFHDGICDMYDCPETDSGERMTLVDAAATTDVDILALAKDTAERKVDSEKVNGLESLAKGYICITNRTVGLAQEPSSASGSASSFKLDITEGTYGNVEYEYFASLRVAENRSYAGLVSKGLIDVGGVSFAEFAGDPTTVVLLFRI